jgi:putative ABC transport system permease protein
VELVLRLLRRPVAALFGGPGRIALAGLAASRRRGGVASGAVLIGLALVLCLATFVQSFRGAMFTWIDRAVPADLFVTSGTATIGLTNTPMDEALGDEIRTIPGVKTINEVRLKWIDALGLHLALYGLDFANYFAQVDPPLIEGTEEGMTAGVQAGGVVISDNLSRRKGLHVGSRIELPMPAGLREFEVVGVLNDYSSDQGVLMLDRPYLKRFYDDALIDSFNVFLAPGADPAAVRAEIERRLGPRVDLSISSNAELRASVIELIDDFFSLVYVLLFIAVAVSVLGVAGTLFSQVVDRTREIGILRALGASRGQIVGSVAIEAGLLGLSGALLGLPTGLAMGHVFVDVVGVQATGWLFPTLFPASFAALAALGAVLFSAAGGLLPARNAARLDVVEAISYE